VVRVHGKGNKVREVPIKGGTLEAIRAWLTQRGSEPGPLVCPVGKAGRVEPRRLAPQAILRVCEKRGGEAGLAGFAAHDLRRTYISALLYQGVDLSLASDLAGHNSPTTTKRYDRRGERARHAAAAALVVPYVRATPAVEPPLNADDRDQVSSRRGKSRSPTHRSTRTISPTW
jgi:integrase